MGSQVCGACGDIMEGEVTVSYLGTEHKVDIEDVNSEDLKDLFGFDFEVKCLLEVETEKTVLIKKKEKLKSGFSYVIQPPAGAVMARPPEYLDSWVFQNQEIIQHALIVSKAVYETNPTDYLYTTLKDHNLKSLLRSQNGDCHFLLAEELDSNRIYLSFRGTEDTKDLTEDLRIYQKAAVSGLARGKFHAGFLTRAELFPLQKILADEKLLKKSLIVCGHSLGGAIKAIVTTEILIEKEKRPKDQFIENVINITFGAPLFGDETARKFLEERKFSEKMFHFVAEKDPVPSLLSFAQSVSAIKYQVDTQIRNLVGTVNSVGGQSYVEEKKNMLLNTKDQYVSFLSTVGPFVAPALELASIVSPSKGGTARLFMEGINLIMSGMDESKSEEMKRVYIPIGNFFFLFEDKKLTKASSTMKFNEVIEALNILKDVYIQDSLESHKLLNYMRLAKANDAFFQSHYPSEQILCVPLGDGSGDNVITIVRTIEEIGNFKPSLQSAELAAVTGPAIMILRLVLVGENIFQICLGQCLFQFGFPFGQPEVAIVKKIPLGSKVEKVIVEQAMTLSDISVSDHGSNVHLATQFGSCDYLMPKKNIRNIILQSVSQISKHESISLVIKKSVQRGMAMAQLKGKTSHAEPIVTEILNLTEKSLPKYDHERMNTIFSDETKNIQYILSNKEEYQKVSSLCDKIEDFMRSPLEIHAEKSLLQSLSIGALAVLGGGTFAYLAGPGMLLIGAVEALNVTGAMAAGAVGSVGTGYVANRFFTEALADRNYVKVLKWITTELFKVFSVNMKEINPQKVQDVSDLRDDDSIYSNEKAMLLMFDKEIGIENFNGSGIEKSTENSKFELLKRIDCIEIVHKIRNILSTQCFIGLVGLQDSGKTTLLNKVWGFHGSTGLFTHTDVPVMHQISSKVHIIDFPGSNSLDYHAKTFSICGAMNNMIIVIVPFTGDVSELVSSEVAKVFEVMAGSESSRVVVCINKCGMYLQKLKKELEAEKSPINFMKERYALKLNEYFNNSYVRIKKENLLFTDWEVDEEGRVFGIEGVEEVKEFIKNHLVELNVINKDNITELESAVSYPRNLD